MVWTPIPSAGGVHVEWDPTAAATPLGQLPFFVEFLKLGGLFDPWVADCPLTLTSPNAPAKRDILGTLLLAVLAGHQRYAHITALRGDAMNAALLGMARLAVPFVLLRTTLDSNPADTPPPSFIEVIFIVSKLLTRSLSTARIPVHIPGTRFGRTMANRGVA